MIEYQSPEYNNSTAASDSTYMLMSPLAVQEIIYELVVQHFTNNDPAQQGFVWEQRYSPNPTETGITIAMGNSWKNKEASKRPSIFIFREADQIARPTILQAVSVNTKESQTGTLAIHTMRCGIACLATNAGFTEELAEFVRRHFTYYETQIRNDFKFRRFRLSSVSKPQIYVESSDHFIVVLSIETVFDDGVVIYSDDLKLKTISTTIFEGSSNNPLPAQ